jgi:acyl-CoA thioester hydrolase
MSGLTGKTLTITNQITVRFNEVDSMGIVWHGNYIQYLEDSREQFGHIHHIDYLSIAANGYHVPVVDLNIKYRKSLKYGDEANVICTFLDTQAAKIIFQYEIYNIADQQLCATRRNDTGFYQLERRVTTHFSTIFSILERKIRLTIRNANDE